MTEPSAADLLERPSGFMPDLIRDHARRRPERIAVMMDGRGVDYRAFDRIVDRIAASLQRDGVLPGEAVSISAATGLRYAALYIGVLRAGAAVAPIAPSVTGEQMAAMIADSGARLAFLDDGTAATLGAHGDRLTAQIIAIDDGGAGLAWSDWLSGEEATPAHVDPDPDLPFNIIYSSGTTGVPKGIVHSHRMRWRQIAGTKPVGYDEAVLINSTPLYSNTTLVTFLPALAWGGTVVLMKKFEARRFLELAAEVRATHAML
ncbi:MAG: class I adenylate-forming enzyme family protein, partial [Pseudomonadota bacterium]